MLRWLLPSKTFLAMLAVVTLSDTIRMATTFGSTGSIIIWVATLYSTGYINTRSARPLGFLKRLLVIPGLSYVLRSVTLAYINQRLLSILDATVNEMLATPVPYADACYMFIRIFVPLNEPGILHMTQSCFDLYNVSAEVFSVAESGEGTPWRQLIQFTFPLIAECMRISYDLEYAARGECARERVADNRAIGEHMMQIADGCLNLTGQQDDEIIDYLEQMWLPDGLLATSNSDSRKAEEELPLLARSLGPRTNKTGLNLDGIHAAMEFANF